MPKHFFFDLDNTLTRSKSPIAPEHAVILRRLSDRADVVVVSGCAAHEIETRLPVAETGPYHVLGQNGNTARDHGGTEHWVRLLTDEQKQAIYRFTDKARKHLGLAVHDENDLVEDRGSQVSYSLIGHHEDKDKKEAFDPSHAKRHALLREFADDVRMLGEKFAVEIRSGGTTVLDIFQLGKHKGFNVAEYLKVHGWKEEDCMYVGDALFPGGNDETVIGVIPTHAVSEYHETYTYLESLGV